MSTLRPKRHGPTSSGVGEDEADVRVAAKVRYESRVPGLDLLERKATTFFHQLDEPEVAGPEHDYGLVADAIRAWLDGRCGFCAP
jgi:hypothetical protein